MASYMLIPVVANAQMANSDDESRTSLTASPSLLLNPPHVPAVGEMMAGAGLKYSTHVEDPGLYVLFGYQIAEMIGAYMNFSYFFTGSDYTIWTLDFMGRYPVVMSDTGPVIYVTAGLNYLSWSFDYDDEFCGVFGIVCPDASASDVGLNGGGLVEWAMNGFKLIVQANLVGLGGDSSGLEIGAAAAIGL